MATRGKRRWVLLGALGFLVLARVISTEPWQHTYVGNGKFEDRGRGSGGWRYAVHLASLDAERDAGRAFRFSVGALPEPVGVYLVFPAIDGVSPEWVLDAKFKLRLREERSGVLCAEFEGVPRGRINGPEGLLDSLIDSGGTQEWRLKVGKTCGEKRLFFWGPIAPMVLEFEWLGGGRVGARMRRVEVRLMGGFQWE